MQNMLYNMGGASYYCYIYSKYYNKKPAGLAHPTGPFIKQLKVKLTTARQS